MKFIFEITEDGSHTLFVPELNEHYHSTHGAVQESAHVYIDAGFRQCVRKEVRVLEIGFGTGLNAFLTLLETEKTGKKATYTSLELFPLSVQDAEKLNYPSVIAPSYKDSFRKLHTTRWGEWESITPCFSLLKRKTDFSDPSGFSPEETFDVIFFDAFAPDKQPEMWTQPIFDTLYSLCSENAVISTYCAKGSVRRMLKTAGFDVERLPGPPGKREILRGRKKQDR